MLAINMDDVKAVLNLIFPYLIALGIAIVAAVAVMVLCRKQEKSKKFLIRTQAGAALVLAMVIIINLMCTGPLSSLLNLVAGRSSSTISAESISEAEALCEDIADEGIVLLKNEGDMLPLAEKKLNVFGWASTNPCYGGTGSGALSDSYPIVSLLDGLKNAGIETNQELTDFYVAYRADRPVVGIGEQDWTLPEPPAANYSEDLIGSAKSFSDTAVVVITRVGGEGADVPRDLGQVTYNDNSPDYKDFPAGTHFLQLSQTERDMLDLVCANFDNVVVVYNGANPMELGFVDEYPQIKGAIWCAGTGQTGFNGLGSILTGAVNPSGRTIDTFVKDLTSTPTWNNFGDFAYDNTEDMGVEAWGGPATPHFVNYVENIYVGYKFYETAAAEGLIDYDDTVLYPFGYGLSYTTFTQEMSSISTANGALSFDVTVTNTGSAAGKSVVEVYYNPPYTNGGIEKASANLVAYAKTDVIEAGASEKVTITFNEEDMASYSTVANGGKGAYVLESGDYVISINSDSHNILDSQTYTVTSTIDYSGGRSTDQTPAVNQFDSAAGDVTYLSRKDGFANYDEATAAPASLSMSDAHKSTFICNSIYNSADYNDPSDEMPITGAKNGLKLESFRGVAYDDPSWEDLLDQLTIEDMDNLISNGGFATAAVESVGKIDTVDCDGPASINNNFTQQSSIGFPSGVMIAATWNQELAYAFGESIGRMADEMGVSGWYAPAMNIHRSAFAGRNFEYYSEDGLLSGKAAANAVKGASKYGVYAYIKHFALNDQETNRNGMVCTWSSEQAIREIYLKPFELAVKEGGASAVMSAFNYIGTVYAAAVPALQQTVLRDEWGFRGMVLTDWYADYGYQNADQLIRAGNDFCLATYDAGTNHVKDTTSATSVKAMRQASKNILYTVVNSRAYEPENISTGLAKWQMIMITADVVVAAILLAMEVFVIKNYKKLKETA